MAKNDKPQKARIGSSDSMWRSPDTVGPKKGCFGLLVVIGLSGVPVAAAVVYAVN